MIDLARPTAMDYHAEKDHLYLADSEKLRIQRHHIRNGTKETFLDSRLANQTSLKFIYSEKATKFCEIFALLLTGTT